MADTQFFRRSGPFSLESIAHYVGASLSNAASADLPIHDLAALDMAGANDLSLFNDCDYHQAARSSRAGAMITTAKLGPLVSGDACLLYVSDPRVAFAQISRLFYPGLTLRPGIHPSAFVHAQARLGHGCQIDAGAKLGADVTLGRNCHIEANVVIDDGVSLGDECWIGANSTIRHALIGSRTRIGSNSCIGGEGFGFVPTPKGLLRQAQLGRAIIGDGVEIGSNCSVDRGALGDTAIGCGTMIDNLVQIAHNVQLGGHCVLAAQVGIAGSTTIGDQVMIGGQAAIGDHLTIGAKARIAARSGVMRNIPGGETWGGTPAVPIRQWHRQTAYIARLCSRLKNES